MTTAAPKNRNEAKNWLICAGMPSVLVIPASTW
jgi:hypothetical protein